MISGDREQVVVVVRGGAPSDARAACLRAALATEGVDAVLAGADAGLAGVDAVLALDAGALAAARTAGVRVRIAVTRGLAARFGGGLEDATHVALPHAAAGTRAERRIALVVGLVTGQEAATSAAFSAEQRAAARAGAGIRAEARIVVTDAAELRDVGLRAVLLQLALAEPSPAVLFDVGEDAALAEALRVELPGHALDAFVFAGPERATHLPLADLALGRASGEPLERAITAGVPVLPLPAEDGADAIALEVLGACGVAPPPRTLAVLSVALDAALRAPTAVRELDSAGAAARLVAAAHAAVVESRAGLGPRAVGLPTGLERIGSRDDTAPRAHDRRDVEARIDAELAALKKRL